MMRFDLGPSWQKILEEECAKPYIEELAAAIDAERGSPYKRVFPSEALVFNAFLTTPFDQVKVVIVGQDPYHGEGQAHGLAFSVPQGIRPPPSLQNIFKELNADVRELIPSHGCLISWAEQGVLLLNAALTVREGEPLSHQGIGWERFTDAAIDALAKRQEPIVFLLWGKFAENKCSRIKASGNLHHEIFTAAHPSPFSAHRGFFGCRHFSKTNQFLQESGLAPIHWAC